ncbi:MAG: 50S ribosomal protein L6 [Chitinophagales bacterium]|nr:50S ribosomal protein L6 [Bacteroidota bacterium]MCB9042858.1 50S ribosomal protein L6 [Chitinophagales bacterium]
MSRVGKLPISIPNGVSLNVDKFNVKIKGPKGELSQRVHRDIEVSVEDGEVVLKRKNDLKQTRAYHGLYRALINNMIEGVSNGYKKEMELIGVGYRANSTGQLLELSVGYSHPIFFVVPSEIKVTTTAEKGQAPTVILEGIDKQLIGQVCAKLRSFRKPEPYKGKGIRFKGEVIRRKAGKTAAKK